MARKESPLSVKGLLLLGVMFNLLTVQVTGEVTYGRVRLRTRRLLQFETDHQETLDFDRVARSRWTQPGARWKLGMVDNVPSASNTDQREQRDLARHQLDRYTAGFADPVDSGIVEGGPHEAHSQSRIMHPLSSKYRFSAGYQADPTFPDAASGVEWSNNDAAPRQQQGGWSEDLRGVRSESAFTGHGEAIPWDTPVFNPEAVPRYHSQPRAAIPPLPVDVKFIRQDEDAWPSRASLGAGRRIESFPTLQNQPGREYEDAIIRRTLMPSPPSTAPTATHVETGRKTATESASWKTTDSATWKAVDTTTSKAIFTTLKITTSTTPKVLLTTSKNVPLTTPKPQTTTPKVSTSTTSKVAPSTTQTTSTANSKMTPGTTKVATTKDTATVTYTTSTPKDIITTPKVIATTPKVTTTTPKVSTTTPKVTSTTHKVTTKSSLVNDTIAKDKATTEFNTKAEYRGSVNPILGITTENLAPSHADNISGIETSTTTDYDEDLPSIGTMFGLSEDFTDDHMTVKIEYPSTTGELDILSNAEEPSTTDGSIETASEVAVVSEYTASEDFAGTIATMIPETATFPSNFKEPLNNVTTLKPIIPAINPHNLSELTTIKASNGTAVEVHLVDSMVNLTTNSTTVTPPLLKTEASITSTKDILTATATTAIPFTATITVPTTTTSNTTPITRLPSTEQTRPPPPTELQPVKSKNLTPTELTNPPPTTQETPTPTQEIVNPTTQSTLYLTTLPTPQLTSPSAPPARPTSRRRLPSYRPIIRHRVNRPDDVAQSAPSNKRPATRRPPKASRIPTTTPPPPTTTMSYEEDAATDWFTPPMPTEPPTTKRQYVITVPPLVDHVEPRQPKNLDENELPVDPSAESTHGATVAEDDGMHHDSVIPEGATNAIIISGIIGGCAIVFFAVLMAFCMWRQHMSRRPIYPPSNSSTSTSSSGTFNGRFR